MPPRLSQPTSSMSELGMRIAQECWNSGIDARLKSSVALDNQHQGESATRNTRPPDTVAFYDMTGRPLGELRLGGGTLQILIHNAGFEPQAELLARTCRKQGEVEVLRPYMARQSGRLASGYAVKQ